MFYIDMNFKPEDTREEKKSEEMNFPAGLSNYQPFPFKYEMPKQADIYDRNFFRSDFHAEKSTTTNSNDIPNNRIHETPQFSQDLKYDPNQFSNLTRERRCDRNNDSTMYNQISQRNFNMDIQHQNSFLGHKPIDTRNTKQVNPTSQPDMRPTRYMGTPFNKLE